MYGKTEESCDPQTWKHMISTIDNQMIPTIVKVANEIRESYRGALAGGKGFPFTLSQRTTVEWMSETIIDFLWETDANNGIHNAVKTGFEYSFLQGVRPEYQPLVKKTYSEVVGNSLKVAA